METPNEKAKRIIREAWESYVKGLLSYAKFVKIRHYAVTQIMDI